MQTFRKITIGLNAAAFIFCTSTGISMLISGQHATMALVNISLGVLNAALGYGALKRLEEEQK